MAGTEGIQEEKGEITPKQITEHVLLAEELDFVFLGYVGAFPLYAESNLKIQDINSKLVPLILNNVQVLLEEIWVDHETENNGMVRLYILKARRMTVSSVIQGKFFWRTMTSGNHYSVVVTHEPQATDYLFKMQKRFYDNLPSEFQATDRYNNMRTLELNTPEGDGLDSAIRVGTANVGNYGSAMLIHDLHLSEGAKYPKNTQAQLETSILQCVPRIPRTAVVNESTANGMGGSFYTGFWACRTRYTVYLDENQQPKWKKSINPNASVDNMYASVFIPAFAFLQYRAPVPEGFKRTKEEQKLVDEYNCPDEYLVWRRITLANECKGDLNKMQQEYPNNPEEAFLSTGTPSFDVEKVKMGRAAAEKTPPIAKYECILGTGQWMFRIDGDLLVWEEPRPGTPYLISCDPSEGLPHGDFHSLSVWNHLTHQQAAHAHFKIPAYDLATFLFHLGNRYNKARIAAERNNTGILVVERLFRDFHYANLYVEVIDLPPHKPRKRYGWHTSENSRHLIVGTLKYKVYQLNTGIRCVEAFDEMLFFKRQDDGKEAADSGQFDDRVIDAAIGKYLLDTIPPVVVPKVGMVSGRQAQGQQQQSPVPTDVVRRSGQRPDMRAFNE